MQGRMWGILQTLNIWKFQSCDREWPGQWHGFAPGTCFQPLDLLQYMQRKCYQASAQQLTAVVLLKGGASGARSSLFSERLAGRDHGAGTAYLEWPLHDKCPV